VASLELTERPARLPTQRRDVVRVLERAHDVRRPLLRQPPVQDGRFGDRAPRVLQQATFVKSEA
jgi:hypothetical protein